MTDKSCKDRGRLIAREIARIWQARQLIHDHQPDVTDWQASLIDTAEEFLDKAIGNYQELVLALCGSLTEEEDDVMRGLWEPAAKDDDERVRKEEREKWLMALRELADDAAAHLTRKRLVVRLYGFVNAMKNDAVDAVGDDT